MHTALKSHTLFSAASADRNYADGSNCQPQPVASSGFLNLIEADYHQPDPPPDSHPDWDLLLDGLEHQLQQYGQQDCAFTLLLPISGEVDIRMSDSGAQGLHIAMRVPSRVWSVWFDRRWICQQQLSEALQCPIRLQLEQEPDDGSIE